MNNEQPTMRNITITVPLSVYDWLRQDADDEALKVSAVARRWVIRGFRSDPRRGARDGGIGGRAPHFQPPVSPT